ncbi:MAG: AAA family ATPase, partial [Candidatus Thermoplasmatota archaeon]|nr:AAA family ATPase [Candidatus Thermoplasmatota archaeon]
METSWDVTREISLPGIAEGLGVVRSALNIPLSKLEHSNLIFKRMGHVVGGGSRRRQIYHITPKGRLHLEENDTDFSKHQTVVEILGNPPIIDEIFGRKKEREKCLEILNEKSLLVSGMPGIGKSAFVLSLCQELAQQKTVRWAVADQFSDYHAITSTWYLDQLLPRDIESICLKLQNNDDILVIDDVNLVSQRHIDSLQELIEKLCIGSKVRLILISRESSGLFKSLSNFKLDALDLASCCAMLGEHT